MSRPAALPIVEAVEKVLDLYNGYYPDTAKFRVATNSGFLQTVDVFKGFLRHAIAPSSVALEFWTFLQSYFNDNLEQHGDPTHPQSFILIPRSGQWTTVADMLLNMNQTALGDLTNEMNTHAHEWITRLLLPIRSHGNTPGQLISDNSLHQRVATFREQILKREGYACIVTLLNDNAGFKPEEANNWPLVSLEAAHILPFTLGKTENLAWKYIQMFTGDTKIQGILHDINADENGILLQHDVHSAFRALAWGIETQMEDGVCRYFIKESTLGSSSTAQKSEQEQSCTFLTSLATNSRTQTYVFNKLFEHDPDIIGPVAGHYTLPTDPISDRFVIPYFERRLFEESTYVTLDIL